MDDTFFIAGANIGGDLWQVVNKGFFDPS